VHIRDTRKFDTPIKSMDFGSSTGILMPVFDTDTNMLFVAGRGDSSIGYYEFSEDASDCLTEGHRYNGEQTKGVCLVPKRAMRVMETEVNRVLQLTANSVVSIPYHVPRKSYAEFHADLYPRTRGILTTGMACNWMDGHDGEVDKICLDPLLHSKKPMNCSGSGDKLSLAVFKPSLAQRKLEEESIFNKSMSELVFMEDLEDKTGNNPIPEPLPRKKSVSSCSSSEEVGDIVNRSDTKRFFPVPKPRVSNVSPVLMFTILHVACTSEFKMNIYLISIYL
jgi:hypothetical protein